MTEIGTLRGPVRTWPLALLPLLPVFAACGSDDAPPTAGEPLPEGVDTSARGMRSFITRDGIRRAVVVADTAEWHEGNEIHLRRMTLLFFDPSGLESTEVTAEFGIFHELTGDLEAERNVVVEDRRDDQRLETERLRYQNIDGRLYGDTAFYLLRGLEGLTLEGTGFESDPTLDSVIVMNQEGEMRPRVVYSEAVPLPADPAGDTTGAVAADPAAADPAAADPAAADPAAADPAAAELAPTDSTMTEPDAEAQPAQDPTATADSTDIAADPPDLTEILPDSLAAAPDTAAILPDSLVAPPDTAAVLPDSLVAPPDTAEVRPDSLAAPPDTAAVLPDSLAAPPDTTEAKRR